jgi:hypothetical protein
MSRECKFFIPLAIAAAVLSSASMVRAQERAPEPQVCEEVACCSDSTTCAACGLFHAAMSNLPDDAIEYEGLMLENGAALLVSTATAEAQNVIWQVAVARNEILQLARRGAPIELCPACAANVRSFADIQIDVQRVAEGVLLLYTSSDPEIVRLLQAMVVLGRELPL